MIDERHLELIHAEIDGEISPSDKELLRQHMKSNPESRAVYEDLASISDLLTQAEIVEPPPQLRQEILRSIPIQRQASRRENRSYGLFGLDWLSPANFRLAGAFATGALVVMAAVSLESWTDTSSLQMSDLVGTMTRHEPLTGMAATDRISVDLDQLAGSVSLQRSNSFLVVDFDLQSTRAVEVVASFEGSDAQFSGIAKLQNGPTTVTVGDRRISLINEGKQQYAVLLDNAGDSAANIDLEFFVDGRLIHEDGLSYLKTE
ncbi:MAG: anti-sigma factor [Gammaproteobacteria bacterium]